MRADSVRGARSVSSESGRMRTKTGWQILALCCGATLALAPSMPAGQAPSGAPQIIVKAGRWPLDRPQLDSGFRLLYELKFPEARAQFDAWQTAHPEDPLGPAAEAASYLFEEFYAQGVLTSEFFLNDDKVLGGKPLHPDPQRERSFAAAIARARRLGERQWKSDPRDPDALFALALAAGMRADHSSLIEKQQIESLRRVREARRWADRLLQVEPGAADAYLALGAANYIIGSLPVYKRFFLFFGGFHGDKDEGMRQLRRTAEGGRYLRPFAKLLLALTALREKQTAVARTELQQLTAEFPENPLFARELAHLPQASPTEGHP